MDTVLVQYNFILVFIHLKEFVAADAFTIDSLQRRHRRRYTWVPAGRVSA